MSISSRRPLLLLVGLCACLLSPLASADPGKRLRIGITLHPYYSYVANIVGDKAEVVPLIPAGFNPHAYEPRAEDIKRIGGLDVIVLNGVGHDDFADRMIAASETPNIKTIEANENVPLLAATGTAARGAGKVVNPHTFLSISASIAQVNNIARELGKLDPDNAKTYTQNARAYGKRLRQMRADALAKLTRRRTPNCAWPRARGLRLPAARVRPGSDRRGRTGPRHRAEPEPVEKTIDQLRELDVKVIFSEMDFPSTYVETIQRESGVKLYPLSHFLRRIQRRQVRSGNDRQPRHRGAGDSGVRGMTAKADTRTSLLAKAPGQPTSLSNDTASRALLHRIGRL
jgi:zinc transport system substrate-binding protein